MSELISGKEALIALANGEEVQYKCASDPMIDRWTTITNHYLTQYNLGCFLNLDTTWEFRLKPRTITINGIEVGVLVSSQWIAAESNKVKLEFNSKEEAHYFYTKAMEIFNTKKGSEND